MPQQLMPTSPHNFMLQCRNSRCTQVVPKQAEWAWQHVQAAILLNTQLLRLQLVDKCQATK